MPTVKGALSTVFTLGALGVGATLAGHLLLPFFGASAEVAAAMPGATNLDVLVSLWKPLVSDMAGNFDIMAGISKIFGGVMELGDSGFDVLAAGFNTFGTDASFFGAMGDALHAPANL